MSIVETKKPGRPPVVISWPDGVFTVEQLRKATNLSKVTLYQKIDDAINQGVISKIGKESSHHGRPRDLYRKTVVAPVSEVTPVVSQVTPEVLPEPAPVTA